MTTGPEFQPVERQAEYDTWWGQVEPLLLQGQEQGFCYLGCDTHDLLLTEPEAEARWHPEASNDRCVAMVRLLDPRTNYPD